MSVLTLNLFIVGLVVFALVLGMVLGAELTHSRQRAKRRQADRRRRAQRASAPARIKRGVEMAMDPSQPWNQRPDGATTGPWRHGHDERP